MNQTELNKPISNTNNPFLCSFEDEKPRRRDGGNTYKRHDRAIYRTNSGSKKNKLFFWIANLKLDPKPLKRKRHFVPLLVETKKWMALDKDKRERKIKKNMEE